MNHSLARTVHTLLAAAVLALVPSALAQNEKVLESLHELHEQCIQPGHVLTQREGTQAADRLNVWKIDVDKLTGEPKAEALGVRVFAALATGDADGAKHAFAPLLEEFPERAATQQIRYLVACANADAYDGEAALKELSGMVKGDERRTVSNRRRWIRGVGEKAPDVEIRTEDMTSFETRKRGDNVLLIDFWSLRAEADSPHEKSLKAIYKKLENERYLDFVGVNKDDENDIDAARKAAEERGFEWKQRYEGDSRHAPITDEAFSAGRPPWAVIIDSYGYLRMVGDASETAFQYALRAALSEAAGEHEAVRPRTRDGQVVERAGDSLSTSGGGKDKADKGDTGQLPSNEEAESKLRQARTFWRTGMKSKALELYHEIVNKYPGTIQAKKAAEFLEGVEP